MSKVTNGQNVENFEKREKLRWGMIINLLITIILATASLAININNGNAIIANTCTVVSLIFFFITYILKNMRDKIPVALSDNLKELKQQNEEKKTKPTKTKNKKAKKHTK